MSRSAQPTSSFCGRNIIPACDRMKSPDRIRNKKKIAQTTASNLVLVHDQQKTKYCTRIRNALTLCSFRIEKNKTDEKLSNVELADDRETKTKLHEKRRNLVLVDLKNRRVAQKTKIITLCSILIGEKKIAQKTGLFSQHQARWSVGQSERAPVSLFSSEIFLVCLKMAKRTMPKGLK